MSSQLSPLEKQVYENSLSIIFKNFFENDTLNKLVMGTGIAKEQDYKKYELNSHAASKGFSFAEQKNNDEPQFKMHKSGLFSSLIENIVWQDQIKNGKTESNAFSFELEINGKKEMFNVDIDTNTLWLTVKSPALVNVWNKMLEVKGYPTYQDDISVPQERKRTFRP